jgi:hypothetical protein
MSGEAWLIGRKVDASKKIFVATGILVFDFELFIGGYGQKTRTNSLKLTVHNVLNEGSLVPVKRTVFLYFRLQSYRQECESHDAPCKQSSHHGLQG